MKFAVFCLIILNMSVSFAQVKITNTKSKQSVEISEDLLVALKKWDPQVSFYELNDFAPTVAKLFKEDPKALPMALLADFNGDGQQDAALLVHNKKKQTALIVLKEKQGYKLITVGSQDYIKPKSASMPMGDDGQIEYGLNFYLSELSAKDISFKKGGISARDALQLETYGGETKAYYLDAKNKVHEYKGSAE